MDVVRTTGGGEIAYAIYVTSEEGIVGYLGSRAEEGIDDAKFLAEVVANHPIESVGFASLYVFIKGRGWFRGGKKKRVRNGPNYITFNKSHRTAKPKPRGLGPNGGKLESHHGLQGDWARKNLPNYDYGSAPTITIEAGKGYPHQVINDAQNARQLAREAAGKGSWSSTLQEELQYIVDDLSKAGFSKKDIEQVLEQQYKMLTTLEVPFTRIRVVIK